MAFVIGTGSASIAYNPNTLRGDYTPFVQEVSIDGRKLTVPWGGGNNQRKYLPTSGLSSLKTPESVSTGDASSYVTLDDLIRYSNLGLFGSQGSNGSDGVDGEDGESGSTQDWTNLIASIQNAVTGLRGATGAQGPAGADGIGGVVGSIECGYETAGVLDGQMTWVKDSTGTWNPATTTIIVRATFYRNGTECAQAQVTVTLNTSTGELTYGSFSNTGETVGVNYNGGSYGGLTITFTHVDSSVNVSENVLAVISGRDATIYYILPTDGLVIRNGVGSLTLEAHQIQDGVDSVLSSGVIQLYDGATALGYSEELDASAIAGNKTIYLKDDVGTVYDTCTLLDITDATSSLLTGCQFRLKFDETAGSSALLDTSGYGNNPTTVNNVVTAVGGQIGNCGQFSMASTSYLVVPDADELDVGTGDYTFSFRIKAGATQPANWIYLWRKRDGAGLGYIIYIDTNTGKIWVYLSDSTSAAGYSVYNTINILDDAWHRVVITVDRDSGVSFYIDGVLDTNTGESGVLADNTGTLSNTGNLYVGGYSTGYNLNGLLDEVCLYNRKVTVPEIAVLSAETTTAFIDYDFSSVMGAVTSDNGLSFVESSAGTWTPSGTTTLTVEFYQKGTLIATRTAVVTRSSATLSAPDGSSAVDGITYERIGNTTSALTVQFTHVASGAIATETLYAVEAGEQGPAGSSTPIYYIYAPGGTAIKNGTGSIRLMAYKIIDGVRSICSGSDPYLFANGVNLGFDKTFLPADIGGSLVVALYTGSVVMDSITILDITDGLSASLDIPMLSGFSQTPSSTGTTLPSSGMYVAYKGTRYAIGDVKVGGVTNFKVPTGYFLTWTPSSAGTITATTSLTSVLNPALYGNNAYWMLGFTETSGSSVYAVVSSASRALNAGIIKANFLSAITANLGTVYCDTASSIGGSVTMKNTTAGQTFFTQWRLDSTGLAGRSASTLAGVESATWKYVAKILPSTGQTVASFDAYNTGEVIGGVGIAAITGRSMVATYAGTDTFNSGYQVSTSNTSAPSIAYSSVSGARILISPELTLGTIDQYVYLTSTSVQLQYAPYANPYSGVAGTYVTGRLMMDLLLVEPDNTLTTVQTGAYVNMQVNRNYSGRTDRSLYWDNVLGISTSPLNSFKPTNYGITVGDKFKMVIRFYWASSGLAGTDWGIAWKGSFDYDTFGASQGLVKT